MAIQLPVINNLQNNKTVQKIFIYSLIGLLPLGTLAQSIPQRVIGTGGGEYKNGNKNLTVTIGEPVVETDRTANKIITAGFQQSFNGVALPVNLLSFTGRLVNNQTLLEWITAQEIHNDHFDVERSANGQVFEKIAVVKGHGDSQVPQTYHATDPSPYTGITFYRLKQVDADGHFVYSPVIFVRRGEDISYLVYPNPATDKVITILHTPRAQQLVFDMYDGTGRLVASKTIMSVEGANRFEWDISAYTHGAYFIKCRNIALPVLKIVKE